MLVLRVAQTKLMTVNGAAFLRFAGKVLWLSAAGKSLQEADVGDWSAHKRSQMNHQD